MGDGVAYFYYRYFHAHRKYVFNWICSRLDGNSELAQEIYQETMLKAMENRCKLKNREQCKTWLCTIAAHAISDHFRQQRQADIVPLELLEECCGGEDPTPEAVARKQEAIFLRSCLECMDENARYVIRCHTESGMTFREIAEDMGENVNTVASWYRRGLEQLRRLLEEEGGFGK